MTSSKLRIVLPGGSGHIGTMLARHFHRIGHAVTVLSRSPQAAPWRSVIWNAITTGDWVDELEGADVCINLTGRSVNCRYGAANRKEIYDSRIESTRLLGEVIGSLKIPPRVWFNSSTATIYRHSLDTPMDEVTGELGGNEDGAPDTWNFSNRVAKDWEAAFFAAPTPRTRKVALRSAVTFSADPVDDKGSVFNVLSNLVRLGMGGTNGIGDQMVSWVHGQDFLRAVDFLIAKESVSGVVNIAAPNPLQNHDFMRELRQAWGIPIGLPAPAWLIEIGCFFLRTESELVLKSRYVLPGRLQQAEFQFLHPNWPAAAADLVSQWRKGTPLS